MRPPGLVNARPSGFPPGGTEGNAAPGLQKDIETFIAEEGRLQPEDQQSLRKFLEKLGISTFNELAELSYFEPLDEYLRSQLERHEAQAGPFNTQARIAIGRIIKVVRSIEQRPAAAPEVQLQDDSTRDLLAGMLADKGETTSLQRLLTTRKVNVRQLIDAAGYGEPAPKTLISDEDLKKISVAAELGYAMPPHVCDFPDPNRPNEHLFPDLVAAIGRFAHGGLSQWRHDPATAMNMFTEAAAIASDRNLGSASRAARIAAEYLEKCREQLFAWSRSHSQKQSVASDGFATQVTKQYTSRDTQCYQDALQAVDAKHTKDRISSHQQQQQQGPSANALGPHCLSYALGKCTNKNCKFAHTCAFCADNSRGCPGSGSLEWHLEHLRQPLALRHAPKSHAPKSSGKGGGGSHRKREARTRSRSPRDRRVKQEDSEGTDEHPRRGKRGPG